MVILGINFVFHDSSACIIKDGKLIVALEEERFSRKKHGGQFPSKSISKCLEIAELTFDDIDHIAFSFSPSLDIVKKIKHSLKYPHKFWPIFNLQVVRFYWRYRTINKWYKSTFNRKKQPELHWVPHHQSHVAGSFYVSPYKSAALLSMDGSGEWATAYLGHGNGNTVTEISQTYFPHSLGSIYEAITVFCGFKPAYDEGKTMGLAPLGNSATYIEQARETIRVNDDGTINIDFSYFNFHLCQHDYLSEKFIQTFGLARKPDEDFAQNHLDVAAAFQQLLEEVALKLCDILYEKTNEDYLVIAGGVALNSVMNGRIVRESKFKDIYVMPAAGDNGTSIGAAAYVHNQILNQPRTFSHMQPFIGNEYSNDEIKAILDECKLSYEYYENVEAEAAKLLHQGFILCNFQGRMEIGPRALGNRSILADPTKSSMKDKINAEVKHREAYRPFAPSVVAERVSEFFDIDVEAPFMLKVCPVKEDKKSDLPAITHVDGSARVQTVRKEINERYHKIISEFGKLSGVPVVLNSSFNVMGEPIVESPYDAVRCFFSTGLDFLVIGNFIVSK